jgi:hypothetical protein
LEAIALVFGDIDGQLMIGQPLQAAISLSDWRTVDPFAPHCCLPPIFHVVPCGPERHRAAPSRKTLGQHEIAILQATAIDQAAGVVELTTMLCHSSGEWVGSTWPVCSVEEMARPKFAIVSM